MVADGSADLGSTIIRSIASLGNINSGILLDFPVLFLFGQSLGRIWHSFA